MSSSAHAVTFDISEHVRTRPCRQLPGQRDKYQDSMGSPGQVPSLVDLANMDSSRVEQEQFVGLMLQVLSRSAGVPRAYLLPAPLVNDHQEPTFRPEIGPRSKVSMAWSAGLACCCSPCIHAFGLQGSG